ncbi:hypothetical protein K6W36_12215 [Acetobacter senegalensis]|uniref:hypothetical protein n=1 Tax=Acetobacter senegalensis TaxID=446692 RepID=UPI001EDB8EE3|nr:hypothetical protein [Acetobacter senegalensis]MCG4261329.1 hypothetical protein [Acetobacter senegalensis]
MTIPTNWPNPERPGMPMFPEMSGRHVVGGKLLFWYSDIQKWVTSSPISATKEPNYFVGCEYHGPVITPAQIAEMLAAERERIKNMVVRACNLGNIITASQRDMIIAGIDSETAIRNLGATP